VTDPFRPAPPTFPDARLHRAGVDDAEVERLRDEFDAMPPRERAEFRRFVFAHSDDAIRERVGNVAEATAGTAQPTGGQVTTPEQQQLADDAATPPGATDPGTTADTTPATTEPTPPASPAAAPAPTTAPEEAPAPVATPTPEPVTQQEPVPSPAPAAEEPAAAPAAPPVEAPAPAPTPRRPRPPTPRAPGNPTTEETS
jgi:hypothetical protein